jgi:hypothetical protein
MPAIASLEDLKAAQKDLLEAKDLDELKRVFKKWCRIGWKNICKLWLEERTPEELKGGVELISVGWDEVAFEPTLYIV